MSGERTEQPTAKKLREARERGQVARSRDLALAGASVMATIALARSGERLLEGLGNRLAGDLAHFGDAPLRSVTGGDLSALVVNGSLLMASLVAPIAIATMVTGVLVHGLQGGWNFAPAALQLNWSRLNPASGVSRLGSLQSGVDTLKTLAAVGVIVWLAWGGIERVMNDGPRLAWMAPLAAAHVGWVEAESLLWRTAWGLGALAVADYWLQRHRLIQSLKMTREEVRQEHKESEVSGEVKGKLRQLQRSMARRRMLNDVRKSTVVITNPTHFAVALEYRRGAMAAPLVLAKGADHIALRIREEAQRHNVPIVENKPLAQALFKTAEVGESIPAPLFAAVAEVLAQLVRLKRISL